jgi:hypothetical protein
MKPMPRRAISKRQGLIRRPVRTRMDASAELVRLEYERESLTRRMGELKQRYDHMDGELAKVVTRANHLQVFLEDTHSEQSVAPPQMIAVTVNVPVPSAPVAGRVSPKRKTIVARRTVINSAAPPA